MFVPVNSQKIQIYPSKPVNRSTSALAVDVTGMDGKTMLAFMASLTSTNPKLIDSNAWKQAESRLIIQLALEWSADPTNLTIFNDIYQGVMSIYINAGASPKPDPADALRNRALAIIKSIATFVVVNAKADGITAVPANLEVNAYQANAEDYAAIQYPIFQVESVKTTSLAAALYQAGIYDNVSDIANSYDPTRYHSISGPDIVSSTGLSDKGLKARELVLAFYSAVVPGDPNPYNNPGWQSGDPLPRDFFGMDPKNVQADKSEVSRVRFAELALFWGTRFMLSPNGTGNYMDCANRDARDGIIGKKEAKTPDNKLTYSGQDLRQMAINSLVAAGATNIKSYPLDDYKNAYSIFKADDGLYYAWDRMFETIFQPVKGVGLSGFESAEAAQEFIKANPTPLTTAQIKAIAKGTAGDTAKP